MKFRTRDEWRDYANCYGEDTDLFFSTKAGDIDEALDICRGCDPDVKLACLTAELICEPSTSKENQHGVRGGLLAEDRVRLLKWMNRQELDPWNVQLSDVEDFDSTRQLRIEVDRAI